MVCKSGHKKGRRCPNLREFEANRSTHVSADAAHAFCSRGLNPFRTVDRVAKPYKPSFKMLTRLIMLLLATGLALSAPIPLKTGRSSRIRSFDSLIARISH